MPPRPMPSLKILLIWRMVLLVLSDPVLVTSYMCTTTSAMIHSLPPYQTNFESMEMQRLCTSSTIRKWMYKTTLSSFLDFDLKRETEFYLYNNNCLFNSRRARWRKPIMRGDGDPTKWLSRPRYALFFTCGSSKRHRFQHSTNAFSLPVNRFIFMLLLLFSK